MIQEGTRRQPGPRILVSVGETSGDHHAARVVTELRRLRPDARFVGIAGEELVRAGVEPLFDARSLSVVGLTEVVRHLPRLRNVMRELDRWLRSGAVDLCLTVDYPGFNIRLARRARRHGVPTFHYIAPTIWAWGRRRARSVRRAVDRLAVIFDFEEPLWRREGIDAIWVGHPLAEVPGGESDMDETAFRRWAGLPSGGEIVALLPGSRPQEVERLLPLLVAAARRVRERHGNPLHFVVPRAPGLPAALFRPPHLDPSAGVRVVEGHARAVMAHATVGALASGTAALEAALEELPHVLVYRVSRLTWAIGKRLVRLDRLGLPNILAGRDIAPELLHDPEKAAEMRRNLREVAARLGPPGASRRTAEAIAEVLER